MISSEHLEKFDPFSDRRLDHTSVTMPKVSIIITCYNYVDFIDQCILSVDRQTYENYHCVIVDDCSSDDSVAVMEKAIVSCAHPGKFQVVSTEENVGQLGAMKKGMSFAEGPFVVMIDADDCLLDTFLQAHLDAHLGRLTVAFTSSNQYQIDGKGYLVGGNHQDNQNNGQFRHIYHTQIHHPFWLWSTTSSMMFRKTILDLAMPSDCNEKLRICADNYLVHFCNLLGGSLLIPTIHGCYRRHGENGFAQNPIIGGHLSVGDMSRHPEHEAIRKLLVNRLFEVAPDLTRIFGKGGFLNILMRSVFVREIKGLKKKYPEILDEPVGAYRGQFLRFRYMYKYWGVLGKFMGFFKKS